MAQERRSPARGVKPERGYGGDAPRRGEFEQRGGMPSKAEDDGELEGEHAGLRGRDFYSDEEEISHDLGQPARHEADEELEAGEEDYSYEEEPEPGEHARRAADARGELDRAGGAQRPSSERKTPKKAAKRR